MKNKNVLFIGLATCIMLSLIVGMFYWNSIESTDEPVFIGEPPEFGYMTNPDTDGNVFVPWRQIENATYYDLYRNIDGGDFVLISHQIHNPSMDRASYMDWNLNNGRYGYKIKSIYIDGESDFSIVVFIDVQLI